MATPSREGEVLDGKYRISRKLGEGGMGAVYAGENIRIKKAVAIKILHAAASGVAEIADRFEREAQAAGQIGSEHIAEVHDLGLTGSGEHYMVMEYLEGESLRARLKRVKKIAPTEACRLLMQVLDGLEGAHRAGIIHRDIKPDNVFILREKAGRRDFVKVLDFGISKFTQMTEGEAVTQAGMVMGSPNYMSPEHVRASNEVDARSDIYSVGVMLFEALTGSLPRKSGSYAEQLFKIVYEPFPDARAFAPELPRGIVDVVTRACATDPVQRYQSATGLKLALQGFMDSDPGGLVGAVVPPFPHSTPDPVASRASGSSSQPSFGGGSQPSFGGGSQPSFGGSSQPSFGGGSRPPFGGGSQPSFGGGSQPSFGGGSQPSFASASRPLSTGARTSPLDAHTGAPLSVTQNRPARSSRLVSFLAVGGAALLGMGGASALFAFGPDLRPANSGPTAQPAPASTAASSGAASPPDVTAASAASAEVAAAVASSAASAPASATAPPSSRPAARPRPRARPSSSAGPKKPAAGY